MGITGISVTKESDINSLKLQIVKATQRLLNSQKYRVVANEMSRQAFAQGDVLVPLFPLEEDYLYTLA